MRRHLSRILGIVDGRVWHIRESIWRLLRTMRMLLGNQIGAGSPNRITGRWPRSRLRSGGVLALGVVKNAVGNRGRRRRSMSDMGIRLRVKLRRHHLWWFGAVVRRRWRAILIIVVIHVFSFAREVCGTFVLVRSSILVMTKISFSPCARRREKHARIGIWSKSLQYHCSNTRTAFCCCRK